MKWMFPAMMALLPWTSCQAVTDSFSPVPYEKVAVVPFPIQPEDWKDAAGCYGIWHGFHSRLVDVQPERWLQQRLPQELRGAVTQIRNAGWNGAGYWEFRDAVENLLPSHPEMKVNATDPATAWEAGRRAGAAGWKRALEEAKRIADGKARDQFLLGVLQTAARLESLTDANAMRDEVMAAISSETEARDRAEEDSRRDVQRGGPSQWLALWPARMPAGVPSKFTREIFEHADWFFPNWAEAQQQAAQSGYDAWSHEVEAAEALGQVLAARDPRGAVMWWASWRESSDMEPTEAMARMVARRAPHLVKELFANGKTRPRVQAAARCVADLAAGLEWASQAPGFAEDGNSWLRDWVADFPLVEPATAVDLANKYPSLEIWKSYLTACFLPERHPPQDFLQEMQRVKTPEVRNWVTLSVTARWVKHDTAAALAWLKSLPAGEHRREMAVEMMFPLIEKDPLLAMTTLKAVPEMGDGHRKMFQDSIGNKLQQLAVPPAPVPPEQLPMGWELMRYGFWPIHVFAAPEAPARAWPPGGTTQPVEVGRLRAELAQLAYPGRPAVSDAPLAAEILALGNGTAAALRADFEAHGPVNAREADVRQLLIERWALSEPKAAVTWILDQGSGRDRMALPLALGKLALDDSELAFQWSRRIPAGETADYTSRGIIFTLGSRSYEEAANYAARHRLWMAEELMRDWDRTEPEAAARWRQAHWREE